MRRYGRWCDERFFQNTNEQSVHTQVLICAHVARIRRFKPICLEHRSSSDYHHFGCVFRTSYPNYYTRLSRRVCYLGGAECNQLIAPPPGSLPLHITPSLPLLTDPVRIRNLSFFYPILSDPSYFRYQLFVNHFCADLYSFSLPLKSFNSSSQRISNNGTHW